MTVLTPERLWSIPRVGAPHSTGDGRLIVPVTTYHDDDEALTTLWRVGGRGEKEWFAEGPISGIAVSPDGGVLAYLKKVDSHRQVHVQPLHGGEARAAAELPLGAVGVKWMPDGRLLALAALLASHPDLESTRQHEPDKNLDVHVTEEAIYRYWDSWIDHVYHPVVIHVDTGEVRDLTPGATRFWDWPATHDPISDVDVSPDGALIALSANDSPPPYRELSWSLFLVNSDGSGLRRIDPHRVGHSRRPRFTITGSAIVYGYQAEPDFYACRTQLIRHDLATGGERLLADGWEKSPAGWILDGEGRLLFTAENRGRNQLWRLSAVGEDPERLTESRWVSDPTVSRDGTVHVLAQSLDSPPEVHRVGAPDDDGNHRLERTTRFTAAIFESTETGRVRELSVPGGNGDAIQVWLVDPPQSDPDEALPLVHMIHGGPHSVFGDSWHWRWNAQVVAAAGYRIALVNFHGSTGWDEGFTSSIHGAWGDLPYRDVESASDHLVGLGLANETQMAITGGSYGGYLAAWITAQTDRYACAIAHAAVTNLGGMYASDITFGRSRAYGGEIWEDRARVERWSPSTHAAGYSTPTLVIHGQRDARVPATQGLELYGVLVAKGVPARLLSFPSENHWILSRTNSIRWYQEFLDWLERWL